MTVKELIELLQEQCNPEATVYIETDSGGSELKDDDIFQSEDCGCVTIDISVASLAYKDRSVKRGS